jgi:hypothetical protein
VAGDAPGPGHRARPSRHGAAAPHARERHRSARRDDAHSRWTERALAEAPLERLIEDLFLAVLTRPPSTREAKLFEDLLAEGYSERVVAGPSADAPADGGGGSGLDHAVSWSNHLSAEATRIKIALERAVRRGEPPTARLAPDWRERFEDALWALVNSPEFLFVP